MVWEGKGVIGAGRMLLGATNPLASDPSTIRGAYGVDVGRNVCHGSDEEPGSADREIKLWYVFLILLLSLSLSVLRLVRLMIELLSWHD